VATSLNQFSRSIGSAGAFVFGSLLIARFVPRCNWRSRPTLRRSSISQRCTIHRRARPNRRGAYSDLALAAIRIGLAGALHWFQRRRSRRAG
jgi:hypothetical protein